MSSVEDLHLRIQQLEAENEKLRNDLKRASPSTNQLSDQDGPSNDPDFSLEEFRRYGRQMIVPEFGSLPAQRRLKKAKILVIGAGGLGSPALLYLTAAGVGRIGIVDNDTVDISNLHRQVIHTSDYVGRLKCDSAKSYLNRLNPHVDIVTHPVRLDNGNAFGIFAQYDLIVDCTDAPAIRYLINDVAVLSGKTVVSGSGVKTDGQFTILNLNNTGPCYRCFYPQPPKPESVSSCGDAGVFGPAIGMTGISLATETLKVLTGFYEEKFTPFLAMYTAFPQQVLRQFKMRNRQATCAVCGTQPTIKKEAIESGEINYEVFCGSVNSNVLTSKQRLDAIDVSQRLANEKSSLLLDVRPPEQFKIAQIAGAINLDWVLRLSKLDSPDSVVPETFDKSNDNLYVICRYGNDSQLATKKLIDEFGFMNVHDIKGGLNKWSETVDKKIPKY